MAMSRGYITTETDLNNYFNLRPAADAVIAKNSNIIIFLAPLLFYAV